MEVAMLLKHSIISTGNKCDLTLNELSPDRVNILFGYHLISNLNTLQGYRYIPFQLEQMDESSSVFNATTISILKSAVCVWDYSVKNIAFLQKHGINAQYLPVGYHDVLKRIEQSTDKDIDILFYGSVAGRREKILSDLKLLPGVRTEILFGAYGPQRDAMIARSKIILNIHYYPAQIFEAVRVSYLLNNGCFVISEKSDNYPYPAVSLNMVDSADIVETCKCWLLKNDERQSCAMQNHQEFKVNYNMAALLIPILKE